MSAWVVTEYERVSVQRFQDRLPKYAPGEVESRAYVVDAETEDEAILYVAEGRAGFFAAIPLPPLRAREVNVVLEEKPA